MRLFLKRQEMRERTVLKIGEYARVGQVSIATLRYYDQCGLLKPMVLDPDTGYRYYSLDQLPRLNRILALKELGFPLERIAQLLEEDLPLEQLQGMLTLKQAQTQQMIETEETAIPLPTPLPGNEQIAIRTLSGGLMACTIHTGTDLFLGQAYAALYRWMKDNGYQVIGPARQVRLRHGEHMDPTQYVTEVQFPVARKGMEERT
jgi:DNA-binding transcriptional MerR regulator